MLLLLRAQYEGGREGDIVTVTGIVTLGKQNSNSGAVIHSRPARIVEERAKLLRLQRAQCGGAREGDIVTQPRGS